MVPPGYCGHDARRGPAPPVACTALSRLESATTWSSGSRAGQRHRSGHRQPGGDRSGIGSHRALGRLGHSGVAFGGGCRPAGDHHDQGNQHRHHASGHQPPAGVALVEGRPSASPVQDLADLMAVRHLPDLDSQQSTRWMPWLQPGFRAMKLANPMKPKNSSASTRRRASAFSAAHDSGPIRPDDASASAPRSTMVSMYAGWSVCR